MPQLTPAAKHKAKVMKECLTLFSIAYKMGVYHAFQANDTALCRRFVKKSKQLDHLEFNIVDGDIPMNFRGWITTLKQWIYTVPKGAHKRLPNVEGDMELSLGRCNKEVGAILMLAKDFYVKGVDEYCESPRKEDMSNFLDNAFMDWAHNEVVTAQWVFDHTLRFSMSHCDDYLSDADYKEVVNAPDHKRLDSWFDGMFLLLSFYARQKKYD